MMMPKTPAGSGGDNNAQFAVALYNRTESECTEADDLSFSAGDRLQILESEGDWWLCKLVGSMKSGLVPLNYIDVIVEEKVVEEN